MTKEEMLYELDARTELPECFSPEERKKYADTMERAYEKVRDVDPFPPGTEVEVVNDIDLEDGEGRDSHMIGRIVVIKGNYQYECGRGGFGPTPDILHPRVMTSSEMQAMDGCMPNDLSSMLEYSIMTDDPYAAGAWWPHLAFKPKRIPTPAMTVGKLLEMAKNKRDALIKRESEEAFWLAIGYLRGLRLTSEQIDTVMKIVDGSVSANEKEE
jgi:hypothetical protein